MVTFNGADAAVSLRGDGDVLVPGPPAQEPIAQTAQATPTDAPILETVVRELFI